MNMQHLFKNMQNYFYGGEYEKNSNGWNVIHHNHPLYFMMNGEYLKITDKVRAENGGKSIALSDGVTYYKTGGPADKPLLIPHPWIYGPFIYMG